jgi:hypothetical protein
LAIPAEQLRKHKKTVRWPLIIFTDEGPIEAETRSVTLTGIFIHCKDQLNQNAIYRVIIKHPQGAIEVEGKLIWSNLQCMTHKSKFPGMCFSFLKIFSNPQKLNKVISPTPPSSPKPQPKMKESARV